MWVAYRFASVSSSCVCCSANCIDRKCVIHLGRYDRCKSYGECFRGHRRFGLSRPMLVRGLAHSIYFGC